VPDAATRYAARRGARRRLVADEMPVLSLTTGPTAVIDRRSTRQPRERAGRNEKMLAAEPKDGLKKEDRMTSFAAALNLLWGIGVRDATLLGVLSGLVGYATMRMIDRPPT
jgi:hypothetical protein